MATLMTMLCPSSFAGQINEKARKITREINVNDNILYLGEQQLLENELLLGNSSKS